MKKALRSRLDFFIFVKMPLVKYIIFSESHEWQFGDYALTWIGIVCGLTHGDF